MGQCRHGPTSMLPWTFLSPILLKYFKRKHFAEVFQKEAFCWSISKGSHLVKRNLLHRANSFDFIPLSTGPCTLTTWTPTFHLGSGARASWPSTEVSCLQIPRCQRGWEAPASRTKQHVLRKGAGETVETSDTDEIACGDRVKEICCNVRLI